MAEDEEKNYEALDLEPAPSSKKQNTPGCFLSRGWIVFICVAFIFLIILVIVLAVVLPKCNSKPINVPGTTPDPSANAVPEIPTPPRNIWDNPMLPDNILPQHYTIDLTVDVNNFTFTGKTSVQLNCITRTNIILLHSKELTIHTERTTLELANADGGVINVIDVRLYLENQFILVELGDWLEENTEYILGLEFKGEMKDDLVGLYRSSYTTPEGETRWIAATFFSPTNARKAFPCFDEPGRKANFTFTITHPEGYTALANMNQTGPAEPGPEEGWLTTRFLTTPRMSTYILCYTVMDFDYKETTTKSGVTIRAWSRKEVLGGITYGMDLHRDILEHYEEYFNYPFPLSKIDIVVLSDFLPSAMENWGLITYKESKLLYTPGVTSVGGEEYIVTVTAHELGHQYFGNLATHAWWDYMFLKEGITSFTAYNIGAPFVKPEWNLEIRTTIGSLQSVLEDDALASSRPVQVHVETSDEVSQLFDSIGYSKGAAIARMCMSFLGEETFRKGLQIYIKKYAYDTATNDQMWGSLQEAANADGLDIDVTTVMHTWVLQMGYPVVNITRDYNRNDVISFQAEQKRFLQDPKANTSTHYGDLGYTWWVPLSFTSGSSSASTHPIVWMENGPAESTAEGTSSDWLLVNLDQTGYYRVNYDTKNWKLLSQQLVNNYSMIPQSNRASLINDAFNLAKAGEMSQAIALDITLYLRNETQLLPWNSARAATSYLNVMLSRTGAFGSLKKYMQQQIEPLYQQLGWEHGGTHIEKLTRVVALKTACHYEYTDCVETSLRLYREWMNNASNNLIEADFRSTVYCSAIKAGGPAEWNFAYERYQTDTSAGEKSRLRWAMGCANQPWILSTYLSYTLDSDKIRVQDVVSVVKSVAYNPAGIGLAWDFFRANFDHFREQLGDSIFYFRDLIDGVTYSFNTDFSLKQLLDFLAANPDQGTGEASFKKSVERTQANIRWMEAYLDEVHLWLDQAVASF